MSHLRGVPRPWVLIAVFAITVSGCSGDGEGPELEQEVSKLTIEVSSSASTEGAQIPKKFTCDGEDGSPELRWSGVPSGVKSIAVISDDPDAPGGTWVHWVVYGLPPESTGLPPAVATTETLAGGGKQGTTDFKRLGYGGPCPPQGHGGHHYFFKVYVLDSESTLEAGATKADLLAEMDGHILGQGQLVGTYERK